MISTLKRVIILASQSENRKKVMDSIGLPYKVIPSNIDEKAIRDSDFRTRVEKIATMKAESLLTNYSDSIIIAGDSFAVSHGKVFEKPGTIEEAKEMLRNHSGKTGTLFCGFCYLDLPAKINYSKVITVDFQLRTFSEKEIEKFVTEYPVLEWSGALNPSYPYCAGMIEEVHGSLSAFVYGFPADEVVACLERSGFAI